MMTDVKDDQISNDLISTDEQQTNGLEDTRLVNIIFWFNNYVCVSSIDL